ncbi:MAG: sigma-54 dependent transcriptional regulator [Deltaproteobacteria bacterium]|jgi:DNA-binding NtrC family response regulator|nr:sigma-54 dependent transcriptional regulator [Deltaproteobacteria bacterium]
MTQKSALLDLVVIFCGHMAAGQREKAHALLERLPLSKATANKQTNKLVNKPHANPVADSARLSLALEQLLTYVEEREAKLIDLVAELSALRSEQENRAEKLGRENRDLRAGLHGEFKQIAALTHNPAMRLVFKQAGHIASVDVPVLITGETGTGKGLLAKYIHYSGTRAKAPLVSLNCAAIPTALLESELFGIEKGVASGVSERIGHFEHASGGTLFLDEIGDMPGECQAKILKAIEDESITRVGGRKPLPVDVRLISATHRNLEEACAKGEFRQDLFYRLQVIHIHIPPLRERTEDIRHLATHFLRAACARYGVSASGFTPESLRLLESYAWPGNVRELEHEVERAALLAAEAVIQPEDFSARLAAGWGPTRKSRPNRPSLAADQSSAQSPGSFTGSLTEKLDAHPDLLRGIMRRLLTYSARAISFETDESKQSNAARQAEAAKNSFTETLFIAERKLTQEALDACKGNKTHAAQRLGLSREGLRKKLKRLGLA